MAIIVPGPMIAEARGKMGGQVFSRNGGGMYVKGFAAPVNPSTALQQDVRSIWSILSNAWWDVLTAAQRTAWEDLAAANPQTNSLGQSITLSGLNMYMKFNQQRLVADKAREDAAPISFLKSAADTALTLDDADSGGQTIEFLFNDGADWVLVDEAAMLFYQGKPVSPGRSRFHGPFRVLGVVDGNSITAPTSPADFGTPGPLAWTLVAGQKQFCEAVIIEPGKFPSDRMRTNVFTVS